MVVSVQQYLCGTTWDGCVPSLSVNVPVPVSVSAPVPVLCSLTVPATVLSTVFDSRLSAVRDRFVLTRSTTLLILPVCVGGRPVKLD